MASLGQVATYKPLARCGMEELAARQLGIQPRSGVLFARNADGEQKIVARQRVLDLFHPQQWPHRLHMLTMPGLQWRFERKLLGAREQAWTRKAWPGRTYFTACENDRPVYFSAVSQMPGLHTQDSELKRIKHYRDFCEMGVKTKYASFFFANIDDLMARDYWRFGWDAVWLDYTSALTVERLALIARFYRQFVQHILIVTALKCRFNEKTMRAVEHAGGHSQWLRKHLEGDVLHDFEYFDSSPMAQFAIRRERWKSPLV